MKKIIILICALLMSFCIFTACKDNEGSENNNESQPISGEELLDQISEEIKEVFD